MNNIFEVVKNFFKTNQFYYDLMMGLGTTFIGFLIVLLVFGRKKIVISDKISVSVNQSRDRKIGEPAWKFKIVNKSFFIKFYNFDVKLYGINYITSADNTKTEHKKMIESLAGIRELGCYIPSFILKMIRKKNKDYAINFAYRPLTYSNLMELSKEFEVFELSIFATDSLTGRLHFFKKTFHPTIFVEGDFTNDGNLNEIKSSKIPDEVWKNYKKKQKKENSKMRKIIAAFFIVTAAVVCAFAQSGPMVIITGTSIGDSSNSSDYEKSEKNDNENQKQTEKETVPDSASQSSVKIGDIGPGGGLVFYIEGNKAWECSEVLGERDYSEAIDLCREYRGGGYDDWYLPDEDKLNYIYQNLRKPGRISSNSWFWSSNHTEQRFSDGEQFDYHSGGSLLFVFAIRSFTVEMKPLIEKDVKKEQSKTNNEIASENIEKTNKGEELKKYKIGDIGPGGGLVFYIEGNHAYECSEILGKGNWSEAKTLCSKYHGGGYNDWYLPPLQELNFIYKNLRLTGKIADNTTFWSSLETSSNFAMALDFSDGAGSASTKNITYPVRAVRSFIIDK